MPSAVENEVNLSGGNRERLDRMALAMGMTGDELTSALVDAALPGIVRAVLAMRDPVSNVVPFASKR